MSVAIGVDSHKSSFAVGVLNEIGRPIEIREFSNDRRAHDTAVEWIQAQGSNRVIGIEGSGSYGAGIARALIAAGEDVREVPPFLSHRERKKNPARGKSDAGDALAIARVVSRGDGLSSTLRCDVLQDLKLLTDHRDQLVRSRTQLINRTHRDLVVSHPGYERRIPRLTSKKNLRAAMALLRGDGSVRAELIRNRVGEIRRLDDKVAQLEELIAAKISESGTKLTQLTGVGVITAAKILGEVGDPSRLRSKGAFAMLTGTAPIEASSGKSKRHRLNRGGNRQLNYALHVMALSRCRGHAETKTYMARLRMQGKSHKESIRCLKRHLSNVVFRALQQELGEVVRAA